jgi:hypothetical protein
LETKIVENSFKWYNVMKVETNPAIHPTAKARGLSGGKEVIIKRGIMLTLERD